MNKIKKTSVKDEIEKSFSYDAAGINFFISLMPQFCDVEIWRDMVPLPRFDTYEKFLEEILQPK